MTPRSPLPRPLLSASLSCPIDGASTYDPAAATPLLHHATLRDAATHVVTHPGSRIVAVGNAVNRSGPHGIAGLSLEDERRALEEARASLHRGTPPAT